MRVTQTAEPILRQRSYTMASWGGKGASGNCGMSDWG